MIFVGLGGRADGGGRGRRIGGKSDGDVVEDDGAKNGLGLMAEADSQGKLNGSGVVDVAHGKRCYHREHQMAAVHSKRSVGGQIVCHVKPGAAGRLAPDPIRFR